MLIDEIKDVEIILASRSPRRKALLKGLGLDYKTLDNDSELQEVYPDTLTPGQVPVFLAQLKAKHFADKIQKNTLLITADTIVVCDDRIIGKPSGRDHAIEILGFLSGKKHEVYTGVCLSSATLQTSFLATTHVYFRKLTEEEIIYYIDKYKPFDKAGAYGIQEWIGFAGVEKIEGSYFNVMGLPVEQLYLELEKFVARIKER
ncbi:MAG: Maf family nucleotide pyrophosphatase [Bacteroidota bacterium]|nr:Maf family nucleotide pyrophosphatase [Bacteroidota bacterium]